MEGVGQVLFYRARLEGPIAALVSLTAGPVRRRSGLGGGANAARVTLRYALAPSGLVCTHRGWLHADLPPGTGLAAAGYQVDGDALQLSLRPVRSSRCSPQLLADQFRLPFRLARLEAGALRDLSARLRLRCRAVPGAVLLWGRLVLEFEGQRLQVPFCRLLAASVEPNLRWRAYGGVAELDCRFEAGGQLVGEVVVAALCLGQPPAGAQAEAPPAVAAVRAVGGKVVRIAAELAGEGRALVKGAVELDIDWADRSGWSRWTGREVGFSTLVEIPGLQDGDRLEAVAEIDRLTRLNDRFFLLVAVGVTALRPVHLCLDHQYYRVEQVMGQAVATLEVAEPLFPVPALPLESLVGSVAEAALPRGDAGGWPALRLRVRGPAAAGAGWRCELAWRTGSSGERSVLPFSGSLPAGAEPLLVGLEAFGPDAVRVRARALCGPAGTTRIDPAGRGAEGTTWTTVELPGPVRALAELALAGGTPWEARLLVHLPGGIRLIAADLNLPEGVNGAAWKPVNALAIPTSPRRVQIEVQWERIIG